jgi:hypothetical protein
MFLVIFLVIFRLFLRFRYQSLLHFVQEKQKKASKKKDSKWAVITNGWEPIQMISGGEAALRSREGGGVVGGETTGKTETGLAEGPMRWDARPWLQQRSLWVFRKARAPFISATYILNFMGKHFPRNQYAD